MKVYNFNDHIRLQYNFNKYTRLRESDNYDELSDFIDTLSHESRIELRTELIKNDIPVTKNLFYDYEQQKWIGKN